jgi:hypothetical protein
MTDQQEFLQLAEEIARLSADIPEEELAMLLPSLCERLTADISAEKGSAAASVLAQTIVATIFRRRQEILAVVIH